MEPREYHLDGIYVPMEKAEKVLRLLVEGSIVSMVEPVTGVHTEQFSSSWVLLSRTASTSWLRRFAPSLSEEPMGFRVRAERFSGSHARELRVASDRSTGELHGGGDASP